MRIFGLILAFAPVILWCYGAIDTMRKQTGFAWFNAPDYGTGLPWLIIASTMTAWALVCGVLI